MQVARFAALFAACLVVATGSAPAATTIHLAEVKGPITPATVWYLDLAFDTAAADTPSLVLIEIDTPGGLVASTETIVQRMLASPVPVVVYVTPSGAHAASAGFYILISADVAAMAPGTRTGAASVVYGAGENDPDDILLKKQTQDAAALVRSIAERRGRNVEAAERTVLEAVAYTETEVLDAGLIDLVAGSRDELVDRLDGEEIRRFDGTTLTLELSDAVVVPVKIDFKGRILELVAHPGVAYLLLIVGALGLYIEFHNPGLIVPGVVGGICLILFAVASSVLPVTTLGVLLIVLAIVLFALEVKFVSYGLLTLGGLAALVIGSMMLIDGPIPELRVPPAVYLPTSFVTAAFLAFLVYKIRRAYLDKVETGREGLVGEIGEARTPLTPKGKVYVHGEFWDATCVNGEVASGDAVRVIRVDAMRIVVEPVGEGPAESGRE